jgi:hypothetical protein
MPEQGEKDQRSEEPSFFGGVTRADPIRGGTIRTDTIRRDIVGSSVMVGGDIHITQSLDRLAKAEPGDVQGIAASQIQLLTDFYRLALTQAGRSFRWALIAAGVGLLFFLAAVVFLITQKQQSVATISLVSGALIEVISAINFYLYGRTSAQLAEFHARLEATQRFLLANSICERLEGEAQQAARSDLIKTIATFDLAATPKARELRGHGEKER